MNRYGITAFAARRIRLRPVRWLMLACALTLVTFLSSTTMLALSAIEATSTRIIRAGPALVVSRVDAGGWAAIAVSHAHRIQSIPGVESATPRVWGVLPGPPAVTVMTSSSVAQGHAEVGTGVGAKAGELLVLRGLDGTVHELRVDRSIEEAADVVGYDLVLLHATDARTLLLIPGGSATDIAIESARDEENDALVTEIARVIDHPVRVTTRAQMLGAYRSQLGRAGTLSFIVLVPSILGLLLLAGITASGGDHARADVGKLKLVGWTTGEVVTLHAIEMGFVAFVSVGIGLTTAYAGLFGLDGVTIVTTLLGWEANGPALVLSTEGAIVTMLIIGASVLLPCLVAAAIPSLRLSSTDPLELVEAP